MSQKRDPEATRAALLDAAETLFLEKGVAEASTSEIARRAGVTKSLIHHHFGTKEDLWREVKRRRFGEYTSAQLAMIEGNEGADADLLRQSVELYFRFLERNPHLPRLMAWMALENDHECLDLEDRLMDLGTERIRQAQQAGHLRNDVPPHFVVVSFIGLVVHWFQTKQLHAPDGPPELLDDDRYLEALMKIFFEGMLPRTASPEVER